MITLVAIDVKDNEVGKWAYSEDGSKDTSMIKLFELFTMVWEDRILIEDGDEVWGELDGVSRMRCMGEKFVVVSR